MKAKLPFVLLALAWLTGAAPLLLHAADCSPPPAGLVAWWRAEDKPNPTFTVLDSAGTNNGTSAIPFAPGEVGNAFSFHSVGGSPVTVPNSPSLNPTSGISLEAWIHTTGTRDYAGIIHKFDGTDGIYTGYELSMHTGGRVRADFGGGPAHPDLPYLNVSSADAVTDGNWHHLVATYDGAVALLYVDGVPRDTNYGVGYLVPTPSARPLYIGFDDYGYNPDNNRGFQGEIDEPSVYNRALTTNEVQALFNAGTAGKCLPCARMTRGVVASWRGDGNANDSAHDHHGTLQNGASFADGKVGQAFSFDGSDKFVSVPDSAAWDFGTNDFTIELWTKLNQIQNSMFIHQQSGTGTGGFEFYLQPGFLSFARDASHLVFFRPWSPATNIWYHLALSRTQLNYRIYVDGQQLGSEQSDANPVTDVTGPLRIGNYAIPTYALNGFMDELTIYNRSLSPAEIQAIWNAGSAGKCQRILDWRKLAGGGGASSANGRLLLGSAGQADASGPLTNGPSSLVGGFWAMPVAVQTPGAPELAIGSAANGFLSFSWSPPTAGYRLQVSATLNPPNWTDVTGATNSPVTLPVPSTPPAGFFRLFKP